VKLIDRPVGGRRAVTHVEIRERFGDRATLVACRLETGRTHQIRVHLAARGWPLVGDPAYGEPRWAQVEDPLLSATLRAFPRQALHAWQVAFTHPVTRARVSIEAPVPADIQGLLYAAGLSFAL
jgi:23S rRNA pseudouridine1911/1915/1917 synthase